MNSTFLGAAVMAVVFAVTCMAADESKAKATGVRALKLDGVKLEPGLAEKGKVDKPTIITDETGLKEAFNDKESIAALAKQVDFTKEKLMLFAWAGSGGDRLSPVVSDEKELTVEFRYKAGFTDDYRRHFHFFAVPREAKWRLVKQ